MTSAEHRFADSVLVACPPDALYDLVADVTRMGQWSPTVESCWWDEGAGPDVGAWFSGRNVTPERTWETRSQVVVADRGREFAFEVGRGFVAWSYAFAPEDGGTRLTESWEFLPAGLAFFHEKYGERADAEIAERTAAAHAGIPATLAAIKRAAEAG
jgi:hypothetical protein